MAVGPMLGETWIKEITTDVSSCNQGPKYRSRTKFVDRWCGAAWVKVKQKPMLTL